MTGQYDDDPIWDALFARSQDMLVAMADEALADAKAGRTRPIEELWSGADSSQQRISRRIARRARKRRNH